MIRYWPRAYPLLFAVVAGASWLWTEWRREVPMLREQQLEVIVREQRAEINLLRQALDHQEERSGHVRRLRDEIAVLRQNCTFRDFLN